MKTHTIKIKVALDVEKKRDSNLEHMNLMTTTKPQDTNCGEDSITKLGLFSARSVKQAKQDEASNINNNSFHNVNPSFPNSDNLPEEINNN
jgi:hypothetical protein